MRRAWALAVIALAAAFAVGWWWGQRPVPSPPPPDVDGFLWPLLPVMEPFALRDYEGQPFDVGALAGHWTLLTFGYTHCTEPCAPLLRALSMLRTEAAAKLPRDARVAAWFVSLDHLRDTPAALRDYLHTVDPALRGASAPPEALHLLTRQLGVQVMKIGGEAPDDYWFEFPAVILLIAPDVRPVGEFLPPFDVHEVADHIVRIANFLAHRRAHAAAD